MVVGQLALSLPLLVGAGLLARTLINLQQIDLGYARDGLLTVRLDARRGRLPAGAAQTEALTALLARVRAVPGIAAAAVSDNGLFDGSDNGDTIEVEGYTRSGNGNADRGSRYDAVGPGYFSTLGMPVMAGREIPESDRAGGAKVVRDQRAFARQFFAGRNPIGLHLTQTYAEQRITYEIVGVVGNSRQGRLRGAIEHRFYTPLTQPATAIGSAVLIVRPRGEGAAVLAEIRRVIQQAEPRMTIVQAGARGRRVDRGGSGRTGCSPSSPSPSASSLACSPPSASTACCRTAWRGAPRDRHSQGAWRRHAALMAMILRETGWLLLAGLIVGGALSAGAVQLIASRLYGLSPADPSTFAAAIAILAAVAALAAWLPAYRASRVDPLVALRQE